MTAIRVCAENGSVSGVYSSSQAIHVNMDFLAKAIQPALCVGFDLVASGGVVVARSFQTDFFADKWPTQTIGENHWTCVIPDSLLNAGTYFVSPKIGVHNQHWIVSLDTVVRFEVVLDHGVSPFWNVLTDRNRPGVVAPIFSWYAESKA